MGAALIAHPDDALPDVDPGDIGPRLDDDAAEVASLALAREARGEVLLHEALSDHGLPGVDPGVGHLDAHLPRLRRRARDLPDLEDRGAPVLVEANGSHRAHVQLLWVSLARCARRAQIPRPGVSQAIGGPAQPSAPGPSAAGQPHRPQERGQ